MNCYNCIKKSVCHLDGNPEVGWCRECSECRNKDCHQQINCRVSWEGHVLADLTPITMFKDVCREHSLELATENPKRQVIQYITIK